MKKSRPSSPNCSRPLLALSASLRAVAVAGPLVLLLAAAPAEAVEGQGCAKLEQAAEGQPSPLKIDHDGVTGMFFPMPTARLVLCEVKELRVRRRDAVLVDRGLKLWEARTTNLKEQVALAVEARDHLSSVVAASDRRAREAEARLDHWSRSPTMWFALGAAATVVVFFGSVYALDAIRKN